jgi:hypothetical protein
VHGATEYYKQTKEADVIGAAVTTRKINKMKRCEHCCGTGNHLYTGHVCIECAGTGFTIDSNPNEPNNYQQAVRERLYDAPKGTEGMTKESLLTES